MTNMTEYVINRTLHGDFKKKFGRVHKDILIEIAKDLNDEMKKRKMNETDFIEYSYYESKNETMNKIEMGAQLIDRQERFI